jgi:hypothetical protein
MEQAETLRPPRTTEAEINYLAPDGPPTYRRYVAAGAEVNTGSFVPHRVTIRDGSSVRDQLTLDGNGFALFDHTSAVGDFSDKAAVDRTYADEVVAAEMEWTGATIVAPFGWKLRTAGEIVDVEGVEGYDHRSGDGMQPPATDVHVDTYPARFEHITRKAYRRVRPDGPGYTRCMYLSLWRAISEPPQDWPLAVCDGRSVRDDEGVPNTLHIVDRIPEGADRYAPVPGEEQLAAGTLFHHNQEHRWWYFSNMTRDQALLFKFHDSDRTTAWRCPHTAFRDLSFPDATTRASIEFRTIAFFE